MEDLEHLSDGEGLLDDEYLTNEEIQDNDLNEIFAEMANHLAAGEGVRVETDNQFELTIAEPPMQHNGVLIRAEEEAEVHDIQVTNPNAIVRIYHQEQRPLNVIIEGGLIIEGDLTVAGNLTTRGQIEHHGQTVEKNIYKYNIGTSVLKLDANSNIVTLDDVEIKNASVLGSQILKSLRKLHDDLNVNGDAKDFFKL